MGPNPLWLLEDLARDLDLRPGMQVQWEVTDLGTVTSARLQEDGWRDWLLWTRAVAEHTGDWPGSPHHRQAVIDLLAADAGELLGFAMVTARKN